MTDDRDWREQVALEMMEQHPSLTRDLIDNMSNAILALCDGAKAAKLTPEEWLELFECPMGVDAKPLFYPLLGAMERATIQEVGETGWRQVRGIIRVPALGRDEQGAWAMVHINPNLAGSGLPDLTGR